jgi:kynureninase
VSEGVVIRVGSIYRYICGIPVGCMGGLYRVERFIEHVPSYQEQVLVQCVEGIDKGWWGCCTPANFATRYELASHAGESVNEPEPVPEFVERPTPDSHLRNAAH